MRAVNKARPGLIRIQADELTYSLHIMVRYEVEKFLVEQGMDVRELPEIWAEKYREYLGVCPENDGEGQWVSPDNAAKFDDENLGFLKNLTSNTGFLIFNSRYANAIKKIIPTIVKITPDISFKVVKP